MKTFLTFLFIVLCLAQQATAQGLHIDSTRFITGTMPYTQINFAMPTADKGILFAGSASYNAGGIIPSIPYGNDNVLIGKIDSNQQISWIKEYGGSDDDGAVSACQTPDGGYAVLGGTSSIDGDVTGYKGGGSDIWLLRIDALGNLLWEKTYGSSAQDGPLSIAYTPDHGFIMLGLTNGNDDDVPFHYGDFYSFDWLIVKIDSIGNVQWSKDLGGSGTDGSGSILTIDNSYYLVANSNSTDHDCTDMSWHPGVNTGADYYVLKLDDTGKVLWDSSYGGSDGDGVNYAMFDTRDSTIMVIGHTNSSDYMVTGYQGGGDMWVVKVNKNGTLIWQKTLGSAQQENGTGICPGSDGGYMVYGSTYEGPIGGEDAWLFVIDSAGNSLSNKIFGGTQDELPTSVIPYSRGYVATGLSISTVFSEGITNGRYCSGEGGFITYIDSETLAIMNVNKDPKAFQIYPNPTNDKARIIVPVNEYGHLRVVNTMGQVVYTHEINGQINYWEINTIEWANGIYWIVWQSEDGTTMTTKLIKN